MNLKSSRELTLMAKAGKVVSGALSLAKELCAVGITTAQIDREIEDYIVKHSAVPSFKGYRGYPHCTCISINEQIVHGFPSSRVIQSGDIVSIDVGACLDGYHSDAARTFAVGDASPEALRLIQVTEQCFFAGIKRAREGERLGDISHAIQEVAEGAGYGVVRELVGHGIGRNLHEAPDVPNFGLSGRGIRLQAGLTIAVEPMINAGTRNVIMLDDGWTVVTADSNLSAHYENTIAITDGEPIIFTLP